MADDFTEFHDELRAVACDLLAKDREPGWQELVDAGWVELEPGGGLGAGEGVGLGSGCRGWSERRQRHVLSLR